MDFEEFKKRLTNLDGDLPFSFGRNWLDYSTKFIDENVVERHSADITSVLASVNIAITGKTVLDIGCGSGISSASFLKQGASSVVAIDVDPNSVAATKNTVGKYCASTGSQNFVVRELSVLDPYFIDLGKFDLVYSWGVLHHTGDMWNAIKSAIKMVGEGGIFYVALYQAGDKYNDHLKSKFYFSFLDRPGKERFLYDYLDNIYIRRGIDIWIPDSRGMIPFYDALDWLGGLPYEVATPEVLSSFCSQFGLTELKRVPGSQGGNFIQIFRKGKG